MSLEHHQTNVLCTRIYTLLDQKHICKSELHMNTAWCTYKLQKLFPHLSAYHLTQMSKMTLHNVHDFIDISLHYSLSDSELKLVHIHKLPSIMSNAQIIPIYHSTYSITGMKKKEFERCSFCYCFNH